MKTREITYDDIYDQVSNILNFESEELKKKVVHHICLGKSVLVDALSYIGNGRHERKNKKDRYRFKMIVPIIDDLGRLYSTDLYTESGNALKGKYAIYQFTRQLAIDFVCTVDTDFEESRFEYGYDKESYGFNKIYVL